jgi:outer membrane autotransporter protein
MARCKATLIGVATFTNSGTIDLQANPVPGDVLMITGGRGGSTPGTGGGGTFITGGKLMLDTVLNEGGAATLSDTLVVDGTQVGPNGATSIAIRNAGGTGALTQGDGILVVQVLDPARSAGGAFELLGNQELRAGDFDYRLFHGGIGGSNPGDWFLRNEFVVPGGPPVVPPGETETKLPPNPPPDPLPPGVFPIIGPEIATYGVVQPLARQLGLAILGTLDDRVGDTYEPDVGAVAPAAETIPSGISKEGGKEVVAPPPPVAAAPCRFCPSVWSRFFAQSIDTHYRAFADPSASGNLWGLQVGVDLLRGSLIAGHYERAGVYGAFGELNSDVHGLVTNPEATDYSLGHTGSIFLNAISAGGYWTHVGPGGWYLDGVLQGTWYTGSASTQFASLTTDGTGFIASLEGGVPFCWPQSWPQLGPGFVIEPQGQILWQWVHFNDKNDGLGDVALGTTTGASGRIGLRTKWTIATAGGQVWQPYLRANLWRDWQADAHTVFSGRDVAPLESQANWLELGGGLTVRINANVSVFANADYEFAVGNTDDNERNGVRGAFGARYTW